MRFLITGAGGFIGRAVVSQARAEGHQIVEWENLAADPGCLRDAHAVIHLAGRYPVASRPPPTAHELVETNTALTATVLDACAAAGVRPRIVLAGTATVYGPQDAPLTEATPTQAASVYAASKLGAEALLQAAPGAHTCLRLFNVYGPGQPRGNVFDTIASQLVTGGPIHVHNLRPVRDFVHVDDVARAFVAAAAHPATLPPVINIGTACATSINALACCILQAAGLHRTLTTAQEPDAAPERIVADNTLAASTLHWRPRIDLTQGVSDTLERDTHYRSTLETLRHASN
jgi:UDP-glucose 4-epimerase